MASPTSDYEFPAEFAAWLADVIERAGARVALIGGHAVNVWQVPRLTEDYDFTLAADRAAIGRLISEFVGAGLEVIRNEDSGEPSGPDFIQVRHPRTFVAIDMLIAKTPFQARLVERAVMTDKLPFPVATPEDLILLKLIANRSVDQVDALNLAGRNGIDWSYIDAEAPAWEIEDRVQHLKERVAVQTEPQ